MLKYSIGFSCGDCPFAENPAAISHFADLAPLD
jgi:hypothetical protein